MEELVGFVVLAVGMMFGVHYALRSLGWVVRVVWRPRVGDVVFVDYENGGYLVPAMVRVIFPERDEMYVQDSPSPGVLLILHVERDRGVKWHRRSGQRLVYEHNWFSYPGVK